jgi:transposase InsO family protein
MQASLVCDALRMAIWLRRPPPGLIVHSDRGSQYASKAYRRLLKAHGFVGSITKPATQHSRTFCMYIAVFYNNQRLHSYLANQYKTEAAKSIKAA